MLNKKYFSIIGTAAMQSFIVISILYMIYLQMKVKPHVLIIVTLLLFAIHVVASIVSLLRFELPGRILAITNLLELSVISIGGLLWVGVGQFRRFLFWLIILSTSIYLIYSLTRSETKKLFEMK